MNEAELAARGERADTCYREFIGPAIVAQRSAYVGRMAAIAVEELNPKARTEKLTTLATAIKILDNIDQAIRALVEDGKVAQAAMLKVDYVDRMSVPKRRLFEFSPY